MNFRQYPLPPFFSPAKAGKLWRVPYEHRAKQAHAWAKRHHIAPAHQDDLKVNLFLVDMQNTFCLPGGELFVGGRSGLAAVEDIQRLCAFLYRNLGSITHITLTMDTHQAIQVFHAIFLVDEKGHHPPPHTLVSTADIISGRWRFNADIAPAIGLTSLQGQAYLEYYVRQLEQKGKYQLTIWPYHAMLGGVGHALVPLLEEAVFFHSIARSSQAQFEVKGNSPLTEMYSVIQAEVEQDASGRALSQANRKLIEAIRQYDLTIIAGEAKSHCLGNTVNDLLEALTATSPDLIGRIYLLEDATSPVVVPGVLDYTDQADALFRHFEQAGMHIVRTTTSMKNWV